jgi:hypothetical protein
MEKGRGSDVDYQGGSVVIVRSLVNHPVRSISKSQQTDSKRSKPTQKTLGSISPSVRKAVQERSGGRCEVRVMCKGSRAEQQAHKRGRKRMEHRTTADDLWDSCIPCHQWLDSTGQGAIYKREAREAK